MSRFKIDEDIGNWDYDLTGHFEGRYGWVSPMYLTAEGDSLAEFFDTCRVDTCLKDGGEGPSMPYESLPGDLKMRVRKYVIQEYVKQVETLLSKGGKL